MDLRWKESRTQHKATSSAEKGNTKLGTPGKQSFRFVQGQSAQRRKRPRLPRVKTSAGLFSKFRVHDEAELPHKITFPAGTRRIVSQHDKHVLEKSRESRDYPISTVDDDGDETSSTGALPNPTPSDPSELSHREYPATDFDTHVAQISSLQLHPCVQRPNVPHNHHATDNLTAFDMPSPSFSRGVMFRSLAHKYSAMFAMFNEEFCVVPLSTDCLHNPFRARGDFAESYTFLSHAVMALTSHHLSKKRHSVVLQRETHNHWSTALQLLSTALAHTGILPLLDTILLLINFESTQSAFGMLGMHLGGARRLLEQPGAMDTFTSSSRMRAQVAMLVWWDVTSALMSRQPPRLSNPYLTLLQGFDESDGWSFLTLAGCPTEFVIAMARLATLAHSHEREPVVLGIQHPEIQTVLGQVRSFVHVSDFNFESWSSFNTQDANNSLNRHYCIESWRHAIPLFALRVFNSTQTEHDLSQIQCHSRMILDNARYIPPTEPFQKQVLLPVFLAGAEIGDEFNRSFVRQYCEHWSKACNFDQFSGALALLEDIWRDWSVDNRGEYWWGGVLSRVFGSDTGSAEFRKELLLG